MVNTARAVLTYYHRLLDRQTDGRHAACSYVKNQSVPRLLSNTSNGNRLPLYKVEMKVEVGGLSCDIARVTKFAALAWVRDELALSWTELPKQQHSACCKADPQTENPHSTLEERTPEGERRTPYLQPV